MKKRALRKDFHVEVKKSLNRFLSIFFIVALGVAFFSGIQSAAPDMRITEDAYFDDSNLMDIRVISTLGLTDGDVEALAAVEGVENVNGCYMEDVYCGEEDSQNVLHVESIPADMNQLAAVEGEVPSKPGECFLDASFAENHGYLPGDVIEITVSDEDDSSLTRRSFTVSGYGYSPTYISFNKGTTTLGTGSVTGVMYVMAEDFDADFYSVVYITAEGAREETAFTDAYDDLVEAVYDRVADLEDARCEIRYNEVLEEAQQKIADAKQEVEDGKKELEDAKVELEDGKAEAESELAEAESELLDGQSQLRDGKRELNEAQKEILDGEQEVEDGEQEIADSEQQLADGKQQYEDGQTTLNEGEKEYQDGLTQYNSEASAAQKKLTAAQQEIDSGKTALAQGWSEYNTNLAAISEGEQQLAAAQQTLNESQAQYDAGAAQLSDGWAQYEAGAAQLADGQAQYEAGKAQYDAGLAQYEAGKKQYDAGLAQYESGKAQYESGLAQYEAGKAQYDAGLAQYQQAYDSTISSLQQQCDQAAAALASCDQSAASALASLNQKKTDLEQASADPQNDTVNALQQEVTQLQAAYDAAVAAQTQAATAKSQAEAGLKSAQEQFAAQKAELDATAAQLASSKQELDATAAQLASSKQTLDATAAQLASSKQELDATAAQLASSKQTLDANAAALAQTKATLDEKQSELDSAAAQLSAGQQELSAKQAELSEGKAALVQAKTTLEENEAKLSSGQKEIDDGYTQLSQAKAQLTSARQELDLGWAQLNASRSQIADGEQQLEDGRTQLADARTQLSDARQQIADGQKELEDAKQQLKEGWSEYEEGRREAEQQIADGERQIAEAEQKLLDAEDEIADAEQQLADLKFPQWYVNDRNALPEHTGYGENAERMSNLAKVIPVLFFLVAALISLTTMTRMVEEQRTQIGTLKALGYSKAAIASKYIKYAFWATVGGSLLGVLVGEKLLPWVIINAYGIMYLYQPRFLIPYNWDYALIAAGAALFCTIGATFMACWKELLEMPAQLMRPPAPKEGKRVFLERIPFIWRRMSFSWKSTVRNLMRYKKRFLMTVIGIGGCMGLMMIGYGLQDSIMDIGVLQFDELQLQDAMVILDTDASEEEQNEVKEQIAADARVTESKEFYMHQESIRTDGLSNKKWAVYVYVPESTEDLEDFFCFRDRETKETYELTDEGAILTEKVANELGLKAGDTLLLQQDEGDDIEVPIAAVCENYLSHYLYMTPALYEKLYGESPQYNAVFFCSDEEESGIEKIGEELLKGDAVLNITYTGTMAEQIDNMLGAMDIVMIVLIVSAGMLAFVVLYNLNNININERRRELATLKVLGFFDGEVGAYVYRENVLLTLMGVALGVLFGKLLHAYVIATVEVDACMFGRNINPDSFVYGILFTIGFSVIVNFAMYFKLKKIDMVESLKSIE